MSSDVETVVIGAGVVGLAIAAELAVRGQDVLVVEQHARPGSETSSRNSEVIHAGLYYPPGSLKARLCVEGRDLLYRFAADTGVAAPRIGKLLVASAPAEITKLESIAATAAANGVRDLVRLDAAGVHALEPEVRAVAGLLSPSTGIVDSHGFMLALEGRLQAHGGGTALQTEARALAHDAARNIFSLNLASAGSETAITSRRLVIAAGLHATRLARHLTPQRTGYAVPQTYYAKGHYFSLARRAPFSRLVYPMPAGGGLGVHLTIDTGGNARFGPDIEWTDRLDYGFDDMEARRQRFEAAIRLWWPDLPADALVPGMTGIRPKLTRDASVQADFAIHSEADHGIPGLVALYGIESPGLTSSLAIASYVGNLFANH